VLRAASRARHLLILRQVQLVSLCISPLLRTNLSTPPASRVASASPLKEPRRFRPEL